MEIIDRNPAYGRELLPSSSGHDMMGQPYGQRMKSLLLMNCTCKAHARGTTALHPPPPPRLPRRKGQAFVRLFSGLSSCLNSRQPRNQNLLSLPLCSAHGLRPKASQRIRTDLSRRLYIPGDLYILNASGSAKTAVDHLAKNQKKRP